MIPARPACGSVMSEDDLGRTREMLSQKVNAAPARPSKKFFSGKFREEILFIFGNKERANEAQKKKFKQSPGQKYSRS